MGNLFNKYFLSDFVANYRKECLKHIDKLEITESTNITATVQRPVKEYTIEPIEIWSRNHRNLLRPLEK